LGKGIEVNFKQLVNLFKSEKLNELASTPEGSVFLRLRSLSRSIYLNKILNQLKIDLEGVKKADYLEIAFRANPSIKLIENFIKAGYRSEREARKGREQELYNELYKLKFFDWGGLHQNSLEKTIVDNYIKKISSYDLIEKKIDTDLQTSLRGYVLCSWYNHWTSIMIEDVFKDHDRVLPALGLISKIDFFIDGMPFDLKVTYLPEGFISDKRKTSKLRPEATLLRQSAKKLAIPYDDGLTGSAQLENLWTKHVEFNKKGAKEVIKELTDFRMSVVAEIEEDPAELMTWLYENQGLRRFDASNRFFIVLVNTGNFFEGWKLKRALPLLRDATKGFLDGRKKIGKKISFDWEGARYDAIGDVLLIRN